MFGGFLVALFFGVALGNVIRGVPLDGSGNFFLPLRTNWDIFGETGILDWYTVLAGLYAFAVLWLVACTPAYMVGLFWMLFHAAYQFGRILFIRPRMPAAPVEETVEPRAGN